MAYPQRRASSLAAPPAVCDPRREILNDRLVGASFFPFPPTAGRTPPSSMWSSSALRLALGLVALALAAAMASPAQNGWSPEEMRTIRSLWIGNLGPPRPI